MQEHSLRYSLYWAIALPFIPLERAVGAFIVPWEYPHMVIAPRFVLLSDWLLSSSYQAISMPISFISKADMPTLRPFC